MSLPAGGNDPDLVAPLHESVDEVLEREFRPAERRWIGFSYEGDFHALLPQAIAGADGELKLPVLVKMENFV